MTIFRTLRSASLLALSGWLITSCISPPEYSETPEIEFNKLYTARVNDNRGTRDTIIITVNYKDGDGDLGIRESEIDPAAAANPNSYNYVCTLQLRKANGQFEDFNFSSIPGSNDYPGLSGQFPYLRPEEQGDRKAPLKGTIDYSLALFKSPPTIQTGTVLRFKVKIKDRALRESNEVFTSPITIQP